MKAVSMVFAGLLAFAAASNDFKEFATGQQQASEPIAPSYVVSVAKSRDYRCAGSVVSDNLVLTAASCVAAEPVLGDLRVWSDLYEHRIVALRYHENYTSPANDVALIRVSPPFGPYVKKIRLADEVVPPGGGSPNFTGWQIQLPSTRAPVQLQPPVAPCDVPDGQTCVAPPSGDVCYLEIGGPLVLDDVQLGIKPPVSECFSQRTPAVYTNVASNRPWIDEKRIVLSSIDEGMDFLTLLKKVVA